MAQSVISGLCLRGDAVEMPKGGRVRDVHVVKEVVARKRGLVWGEKRSASALAWVLLDARLLAAALQAILDADCALLIGTTRDHTAVTLKLYQGKDSETEYVGTVESLEAALEKCIDAFASSSEDLRAAFGLSAPAV